MNHIACGCDAGDPDSYVHHVMEPINREKAQQVPEPSIEGQIRNLSRKRCLNAGKNPMIPTAKNTHPIS